MTREAFINYMNKWDIPEWFYSIEEKTTKYGIHLEKLDNGLYGVYRMNENGRKWDQINFVRIEDAYFAAIVYAKIEFLPRDNLAYVATTMNTPFPYETPLETKQAFVQDWKKWKEEKDRREGKAEDELQSKSKFVRFMEKLFETRAEKEEKRKKKELEYWLIRNE